MQKSKLDNDLDLIEQVNEPRILKLLPSKLADTVTDNPCIQVDGFIFIWKLI